MSHEAWQQFITERAVTAGRKGEYSVCAMQAPGVLAVSGEDAVTFLQGQATCDMNLISESKSNLGAFCNPKGRVISLFRVVRMAEVFYLLMPAELLPQVQKKLQMYVMRSKVLLQDVSEQFCFLGIVGDCAAQMNQLTGVVLPETVNDAISGEEQCVIRVHGETKRYCLMAPLESAKMFWTSLVESGQFGACGSDEWEQLEVAAGVPIVCEATREAFVPQMLNLDQLDGISFKKGCYTGQEIVARSHYLGKLKRRLFRLRGNEGEMPVVGAAMYGNPQQPEQSIGQVIRVAGKVNDYDLLAVLQMEFAEGEVRLSGPEGVLLDIV